MKKILINCILVVLLVCLIGCASSNNIIATKETNNNNIKIKENVEVILENDKVKEIKYTYKFESSEQANFYYSLNANSNEYFLENVEQKGKQMTGTLKDVSKYENKTKDEIKEVLKSEGYEVK